MRLTIKAISRPIEGSEDEAAAAASGEAPFPGMGVTPHGFFRPFAPPPVERLPPALSEPLTVITWGTGVVQVDTDRDLPS